MISSIKNRLLKNSFLSHSKNYLIAEFFNKGVAFLTIPVFTRLLDPNEYGTLAIVQSIITIFTVFSGLNFHGAIARKVHENDKNFNEFLSSNVIFLLLFNTLLLSIMYLLKGFFAPKFNISNELFLVAVIISILSFFFQLVLSYSQANMKSSFYAKLSVTRNTTLVILSIFWVFLLSEKRFMGKVYAQLVISFVFFIFSMFYIIRKSKFSFKFEYVKYSLLFSIPLIPHALSGIILAQFDRVMINYYSGSYDTGLYSFAYNIGMLMNVVVMSMTKSWTPIFYRHLNEKKYEIIQNIVVKYAKIIYLIAFSIILFSKEIIMIMADEKYYSSLEIIPLVVLSYVGLFLYTLFSGYSLYRKKTGLISIFTFIAGFINILLNYIYIPKYGYIAAAWTTLVSYFILFLLHYLNARFIIRGTIIKIQPIFLNFIVLVGLIIVFILLPSLNLFILLGLKILLILLLFYFYFHKEIKGYITNDN